MRLRQFRRRQEFRRDKCVTPSWIEPVIEMFPLRRDAKYGQYEKAESRQEDEEAKESDEKGG